MQVIESSDPQSSAHKCGFRITNLVLLMFEVFEDSADRFTFRPLKHNKLELNSIAAVLS